MNPNLTAEKRISFIEMMGIPGSYDASVYDHFEDTDKEGLWFIKRFSHITNIQITTHNICVDEPLPELNKVDGLVLAGSYNSVHDNTPWQRKMREWIPQARNQHIPILAICGSHQLLAHQQGADVIPVNEGPFAGTFPVQLTRAGKQSPIMQGINDDDSFHYANNEQVKTVPEGCALLASSSKVSVAALDFGNHCYSTQFHPEGSCASLSTVWRHSRPELIKHYHDNDKGDLLVSNFLRLVTTL